MNSVVTPISQLLTLSQGSNVPIDPDAQTFFTYMSGLADPVPDAYKVYYNDVVTQLKATNGHDGTSLWNSFDVIRLEATYSKTAALQNLKTPGTFTATITNDHGSSFTVDRGLKGNGTNFSVNMNYNPFDGGTYKVQANSQVYGVISLEDTGATDTSQEYGAATTTAGGVYIMVRVTTGAYRDDFLAGAGVTATTASASQSTIKSIGLFQTRKTASLTQIDSTNGYNNVLGAFTGSTDYSVNLDQKEFCRLVNSTRSNFSNKTHALVYAGDKNLDSNKILGIYYKYFLKPLNNAVSKIGNRVCFIGDSMTGPSAALSVDNAYTKRVMTNLGNGWIAANLGIASRGLGTISFGITPSIIGGMAVELEPFRNSNLDKDIIVLFAGTNDIANAGAIGSDIRSYYQTFGTALKALGFKVIIVGIVDRDGGLNITTAQFDTRRGDARTAMLADFNVATAVSNVWASNTQTWCDYYIDTFSNAAFQDASNLTYFQADVIHLNATGAQLLADTFVSPTIQLL